MIESLHIDPGPAHIAALAYRSPEAILLGHGQTTWREKTRSELGLSTDRPIVATGHQTLLWHPGILAKYLVLESVASSSDLATANLVVDQHVGRFGEFEVPIRRSDRTLTTRRIELVQARPEVPMGLQDSFEPPDPPKHLSYALDSVRLGVEQIVSAVRTSRAEPNAALQMAAALAVLMQRWVRPLTNVTATDLIETSLARALLEEIAADPHSMASTYNEAVAAVPEAGIPPLLSRDDYVEVPLWRIRADGSRMRAYDSDVQAVLEASESNVATPFALLPRALFMTALVRLGMCDVFIHGTGGANYDRAMEHWIREWLRVEVASIATVTATLRLPLDGGEAPEFEQAVRDFRRAWHDPETVAPTEKGRPGPTKRVLLEKIRDLPRGSLERRALFHELHRKLASMRKARDDEIGKLARQAESAQQAAESSEIAMRRDWPFALYADAQIDALAAAIRDQLEPRSGAGDFTAASARHRDPGGSRADGADPR